MDDKELYYKIAAEFGVDRNDVYQIWQTYFTYKKEGGLSTKYIIDMLKKAFPGPELFDFFIAFGLAVLSEKMEE